MSNFANKVRVLAENTAKCLYGFEGCDIGTDVSRRNVADASQEQEKYESKQANIAPPISATMAMSEGRVGQMATPTVKGTIEQGDRAPKSSKAGYFLIGILGLLFLAFSLDNEKEEQERLLKTINS